MTIEIFEHIIEEQLTKGRGTLLLNGMKKYKIQSIICCC